MWFHAKKNKKNTLEQPKSPILLCIFGSQVQKWAKIAWKTYSLIAICSILFYYFGPIERLILWCKNTKKTFYLFRPYPDTWLKQNLCLFFIEQKMSSGPLWHTIGRIVLDQHSKEHCNFSGHRASNVCIVIYLYFSLYSKLAQ